MEQMLLMIGFFLFAAVAAYALSAYVSAKPKPRSRPQFKPGQAVRIRTSDGMYRARFVGANDQGYLFSAPIQRDRYVPLRAGEKLTVEVASPAGMYRFRTEVLGRNSESREIQVALPESIHFEDRRQQKRVRGGERQVLVEEDSGWLADIAAQGVCITMDKPVRQGERIRVDLEGKEPAFAWVLECEPNTGPGKGKHRIRARFEEERLPALDS